MRFSTIAALILLALASRASAQSQVTISIQPDVIRSLTVQLATSATYYDLGPMSPGNLISGTTPYVVTNNGNVSESFVLQISSETDPNPGPGIAAPGFPWTGVDAVTTSGALSALRDRYQMFAQFSATSATPSAVPENDQYLVTHSGRTATLIRFASVSENGGAVSAVPGSNGRGLYFYVRGGGYSTTNSQKRIGITISGQ